MYGDLTPVITGQVDVDLARVGALADRLLFGSDAPNTGFTVEHLLATVRSWGLHPNAIDAILGLTANQLTAAVTPT